MQIKVSPVQSQLPKVKGKTSKSRLARLKEFATGYLFLFPALILLLIFLLIPMFVSAYYSFTDYYLLTPDKKEFVGLSNYLYIFEDELFLTALKNTLYFVVIVVPLQSAVGLGLALLVNQKLKGIKLFRIAFFSPVIMSMVVVSILWTFLYNPNEGLINQMLGTVGVGPFKFLTSPDEAMNSIIFMSIWQGAGFQMIIFLAGLQNIPKHLYEAVVIDGANEWQKFIHVTIPGLRNVLIFVFITITIAAFKLLVQPLVMTQGGPLDSTKTLVYLIFETGFKFRDMGYASAMVVLFTLIVLIIAVLQRKLVTEDRG